jgi:hypothetical protein
MTEWQAICITGLLGAVVAYLWQIYGEARATNAKLQHIIDLMVDSRFTYSDDLHLARRELTRIADTLAKREAPTPGSDIERLGRYRSRAK